MSSPMVRGEGDPPPPGPSTCETELTGCRKPFSEVLITRGWVAASDGLSSSIRRGGQAVGNWSPKLLPGCRRRSCWHGREILYPQLYTLHSRSFFDLCCSPDPLPSSPRLQGPPPCRKPSHPKQMNQESGPGPSPLTHYSHH